MKVQRHIFCAMLCIFGLALLGFADISYAGDSKSIPPGTISVDQLTTAKITTRDLCPPKLNCLVGGTIVTMTFDLPTCVDKLGPVNYRRVASAKKVTLYVSAYAFINEMSAFVKCRSIQESVDIALISDFGDIEVKFSERLVNADN